MSDSATQTRPAPAVALTGVTYSYPAADTPALRDISLNLPPGEFTLLAGRSASGKSTLLRAACGLVPHFHGGEIEGRIEVAGIDAIAAGPGELAAVVGYVAQDPETQVVSTTVSAEIELPLEMRGMHRPHVRGRSRRSPSPSPSHTCSTAQSTPSPAESSNASPSPPPSSPVPASSSSMSPHLSWIP